MINKNISVWRGESAPPTKYSLWIKQNECYLYYNDEWTNINTFIPQANENQDGLFSKEDKRRLNLLSNSTLYQYKGTINNILELPSNPEAGDTYNVLSKFELNSNTYPANTNVSWNGIEWDALGGIIDFTEINEKILEIKDNFLKSITGSEYIKISSIKNNSQNISLEICLIDEAKEDNTGIALTYDIKKYIEDNFSWNEYI